MYIPPETNIRILRDVPLDESYNHTVHFGDSESPEGIVQSQKRFFDNYLAYNLTNYTYQRLQKGYIRVGIKAELLYNCNYLMYQNTSFGNKWFYAFITAIEYINNEVSEIHFEIDVMQTWMFDYKLDKCFVERMTPKTDYIGENIIPEPLELGEMVYNKNSIGFPEEYQVLRPNEPVRYWVVIAICDAESTVSGKVYNGIYGGASLYVYDPKASGGVDQINSKLAQYTEKPDAIVGLYVIPSYAISGNTIPAGHLIQQENLGTNYVKTFDHPVADWKLDGYLPQNCKLYTYPYNFLNINNCAGDAMALRYEFFKDQTPKVIMMATVTQPVTVKLNPVNYKNIDFDTLNMVDTETLTLSNYPLCSWSMDAYAAWVAQNAIPATVKVASTATVAALAYATGIPGLGTAAAGVVSTALAVNNACLQGYKASISADIAKGTFNAGSINVSQGRQNFYAGRMSVSYQYAKVIDEYFTRFGYAQNRFMIPTKHNRPYWTYLKTIGCIINGSIPKDDAAKIVEIHDNGCLFIDRQFAEEGMDFTKNNAPSPSGLRGYGPQYVHNGNNPDTV